MTNNYKYSVVIPCYNSGKYIERAMMSIINETYKNVELIVVNDGSIDDSEDIIKNIIAKYPEYTIKYEKIENSGPATARNTGLKKATGDYICFLDSDDEYMPELFEKLDEKIDGSDICYFDFVDCLEDGKVISRYSEKYPRLEPNNGVNMARAKMDGGMWICNCNAVYRMGLLKDNGIMYPEGIFSGEDSCFIYDCLLHADTVTNIQYEGFLCYKRSNSLMHSRIDEKFMTNVDASYEIINRVKNNNLISNEDKKYFINRFEASLYFTNVSIAKKIAYLTPIKEYRNYIKELKKYYVNHDIKYNTVKDCFSIKEKIQIYSLKISKCLFYVIARIHNIRRD